MSGASPLVPSSSPLPHINPVPTLSITGHASSSVIGSTVVLGIFLGIALILVSIRFYIRLFRSHRFFLNDYFLLLGFITTTAYCICAMLALTQGVAEHHLLEVLELAPNRLITAGQFTIAAEFFWVFGTVFIKLSILHLYFQLFGVDTRFAWAAGISAFIVIAVGAIATGLIAQRCSPLHATLLSINRCVDYKRNFLITGILNPIVDLLILTLPMPNLYKLQMPRKRKIGMLFMFGIGFGICGVSIWRIAVIASYTSGDVTWDLQYLGLTTGLELLLGLSIACVPIVYRELREFLSFFMNLRTHLTSFSFTRGTRKTASATSNNISDQSTSTHSRFSKATPNDGQLDRKNFKKLYDHLYPMSDLDKTQLTTREAENPVGSRSDVDEERGEHVEVVREWEVQHSVGHGGT